jgi:hypothetical protein
MFEIINALIVCFLIFIFLPYIIPVIIFLINTAIIGAIGYMGIGVLEIPLTGTTIIVLIVISSVLGFFWTKEFLS